MRLLFGQLEPDKPRHLQEGLQRADNVYPATNGYRPIQEFQGFADALPAAFEGGATFVAGDGTVNLLAGTATNLYRFSAALAWSSILGSLTANRWYFTQFGDVAIATHGGTPVAINLLTGTAAALTVSPPTAFLCTTVRNFVVLGNVDGDENMVRWSGFENHTQWVNGTNQAGEQPMLTGGKVTGLAGGEYGLVFQRSRISRMTYIGTEGGLDLIWQFDEISANIGCIEPGSIAQAGRLVFFLSDRGFMKTDGNDVQPIGAERIDRTFLETYSAEDIEAMYATIDPKNHIVIWAMPGKLWIYDYHLDRWTTSEQPLKAALAGFTAGVSLDELDAIYGDLDAMGSISLDDARFKGGAPLLLLVNSSDEVGTLTGDNLAPLFELPLMEPVQGREIRLSEVRPLTDATANVAIQINQRRRLGDTGVTATFEDMQSNGDIPCRASGRYLGFTVTIAEAEPWSYFQGLDLPLVGAGGKK
jgi:hypothetical protein